MTTICWLHRKGYDREFLRLCGFGTASLRSAPYPLSMTDCTHRTSGGFSRWTLLLCLVITCGGFGSFLVAHQDGDGPVSASSWRMPDEGEPHARTWVCFIADAEIWSKKQVPRVQRDLVLIAKTIAKYEPVSVLVRKQDLETARELLGDDEPSRFPIELVPCELNDLWIRDTGPTFVVGEGKRIAAVDFNFNGWGGKQDCERDAGVAKFVALQSGATHLPSKLTLEGGCFEVDGLGTAIMTESCILNDNRNEGVSKQEAEKELKRLLGLKKIIWLKGAKGQDITDGHTDFYARFARPGVVVVNRDSDLESPDYEVTRENIRLLKSAKDARGESLKLIILDTPWDFESKFALDDFAAGYVGYYLCNGALIMQEFGDRAADQTARRKLKELFPDRKIEVLRLDGIASGGGSIHCSTQQEPKVEGD